MSDAELWRAELLETAARVVDLENRFSGLQNELAKVKDTVSMQGQWILEATGTLSMLHEILDRLVTLHEKKEPGHGGHKEQ